MSLYSRSLLNTSIVLAGLFFSSMALALDKDKTAPVTINADTTNIDFRTGKRVLTGNVDITQGTLNIKADKVVLIYKGDDIDTATAYGKPVKFKQLPEGHTEIVYGEGKTLEITQGTNIITGKVIYYNTKTSKMTVKGQTSTKQKSTTAGKQKSPTTTQSADQKTDSGRTRIVIQPGSMKK
jgi:lipopolysaccharide export system protein LptA